jgi:hypothetical protein
MQIFPGTGRDPSDPTFNPPSGSGKASIGANPGLITSTGGLNGIDGLLLTPAISPITGACFVINHDPTNFDCEESAEYFYRQEANYGQIPGEGRSCTIHLIILKYRELGVANFNVNITVFQQAIDDFVTVQIPVSIPTILLTRKRKNLFPDSKIHTIKITPPKGVIQGERPQISYSRKANSGPISISKLILCGNADETAQQ